MSGKLTPVDPNDIVNAYRSGQSVNAIKQQFRVHTRRVRSILADAGITPRTQAEAAALSRLDLDRAAILSAYERGHSQRALARLHRVDEGVIKRFLQETGTPQRGTSEALRARYRKLGIEPRRLPLDTDEIARHYLAGASASDLASELGVHADTIVRRLKPLGIMRDGWDSIYREKTPTTKGHRGANMGRFEIDVANLLRDRGLEPICQLPVGHRNVDVAIYPIAVEVWFSSLRPDNDAYCRERIVDLAERGWHVAYIHISRRTKTLATAVLDQLVPWLQLAQSEPAGRREYRVIRGTGELLTRGHVYPEYRPLVPAPIDGLDAV